MIFASCSVQYIYISIDYSKSYFKSMRDSMKEQLPAHLDEIMFLRNNKGSLLFPLLLSKIFQFHPCIDYIPNQFQFCKLLAPKDSTNLKSNLEDYVLLTLPSRNEISFQVITSQKLENCVYETLCPNPLLVKKGS